jgi:hypothetical protein
MRSFLCRRVVDSCRVCVMGRRRGLQRWAAKLVRDKGLHVDILVEGECAGQRDGNSW